MKLLLMAPSTRAMAESAKRSGYDFLSLDFFGDIDQKEMCENYSLNHEFIAELSIENLFKHSKELDFTHVIYGSGFENHPELVAELEKGYIILGNDVSALRKVRDWKYLFKTLKKLGISHPETEVVHLSEAQDMLGSGEKFIIKPLKSGGGHSIYDKKSDEIKDKKLEGDVLLQEYIEGMPASSTIVSTRERCFYIGATEQLVGTPFNRYIYAGNVAPLMVDESVLKEIEEISYKIAHAFKLRGCSGIDFILKNTEPYVTEVNPRIPGSMEVLEGAYDINIMDLHVKACLEELEEDDLRMKNPSKFFGKKILFAKKDIFYRVKQRLNFLKDVPCFNERIEERHPICTVVGHGKTAAKCIDDLNEKERKIRNVLGEQ